MKEVNFDSEFLTFIEHNIEGRKTSIYSIHPKRDINTILGCIKWHGAWRKYTFFPEENTIFDSKCLLDIIKFIEDQMKKRKSI